MHINFHITLSKPPAGYTYALQKGSGNNYLPVKVQNSAGTDLFFDAEIEIKGSKQTHDIPDFKGPFVQGPMGSRFIYLDIGSYAGIHNQFNGRLKIPLTGITWAIIEKATSQNSSVLKTNVPGTGKNGMPACATVKPFEGWAV